MNGTTNRSRDYRAIVVYGALLLASIIFIILGYFLEHWNSLASHIMTEIGIAGLIGFLLAMTIERLSAEEFRKLAEKERDAIKTDVFHYVYGRGIPRQITDEIDTQILKSDFVREKLFMDFELGAARDLQTEETYIRSTCKIKYDVKNIATEPRTFPLKHLIDKSPSPSLASEVKYISLSVTGCKNPFELNEQQLQNRRIESEAGILLNVEQQIIVLTDRLTTIKLKYQAIRNLRGGRIYFAFSTHTCDFDLTVIVPNREVIVFAVAYSQNPLNETDRHRPSNGYYNWSIEKPLLAYQGVYVGWEPKSSITSVIRPTELPRNERTLQEVNGEEEGLDSHKGSNKSAPSS